MASVGHDSNSMQTPRKGRDRDDSCSPVSISEFTESTGRKQNKVFDLSPLDCHGDGDINDVVSKVLQASFPPNDNEKMQDDDKNKKGANKPRKLSLTKSTQSQQSSRSQKSQKGSGSRPMTKPKPKTTKKTQTTQTRLCFKTTQTQLSFTKRDSTSVSQTVSH